MLSVPRQVLHVSSFARCALSCCSGETVYSNIIKLKVAKATTNECSFPRFKIALVVCEEKYHKTQQFPSLKATRNDGEALIKALQELQFQVGSHRFMEIELSG